MLLYRNESYLILGRPKTTLSRHHKSWKCFYSVQQEGCLTQIYISVSQVTIIFVQSISQVTIIFSQSNRTIFLEYSSVYLKPSSLNVVPFEHDSKNICLLYCLSLKKNATWKCTPFKKTRPVFQKEIREYILTSNSSSNKKSWSETQMIW